MTGTFGDQVDQLQQASSHSRPSTDVEGLTTQTLTVVVGKKKGLDKILDEQHIAHLLSIAIKSNRLSLEGADQEVRHPTLIFIAALMRTVNAAHPKDQGFQAEGVRVVQNILIGSSFRAAVGTMEAKRPILTDPESSYSLIDWLVALIFRFQMEVVEVSINLVRRGVNQRWRIDHRGGVLRAGSTCPAGSRRSHSWGSAD